MDVEDLTPLTRKEQINSRRKPTVLLLVVLWSMGIINWSPPNGEGDEDLFLGPIIGNFRFCRKPVFILSVFAIFTLAATSYFGAAMYFICFFGLKEHFVRFVIVIVCYWPSLISGSIFFLPALVKNNCRKSKSGKREISWITMFQESTFLKRLSNLEKFSTFPVPRLWIFVFFHFCGLLVSSVILVIYITVYTKCLTWLSYVWIAGQLIALTYFANFCYFLYLQRIILEVEYEQTESFIEQNPGQLEDCTEAVKRFFCKYYQLRKLFLLWLNIIFCSITFGVAAYVTWSYKGPEVTANSTVLPTQFPLHLEGIRKACPYSCDSKYLENHHSLFIYNCLAFAKLLIPAVLSLSATGGLDIKYMWNRLILSLRLMSTTGESDFWYPLIKYTEKLHPKTTMDTKLRFIIPILGLAFGFLGGYKNKE
ncbi:hypothetical protein HOLleu_40590 [Holothuria leucospilota]|uniref:Uncharacterized protein n=1 Tax=Holothuria leucospilota TaxID=206669 RepID=A0A9Q0YGA9_HOLLE|nr:hypothetical protein HOLleu_40590 [Holothuria leucospilota]